MQPIALAEATYTFVCPRIALMGVGSSNEAGAQAKALGVTHVLLVTDKVLTKIGLVQQIASQVEAAGLQVTVFDGADPNPTDKNVHAGASLYRENKCDALISLGGGSAHDCAKGIGIVISNGGDVLSYAGVGLLKKPLPPLIAINTTAGTGSECTRTAIITDSATHAKTAIVDEHNIPLVAINDPKLMLGMPPALTASTGMDALTHAIEAYVSIAATPLTEALAIGAIELIGAWLRSAVTNGANLQARDKMAYAEYMAGMAFSNGRLGCVHAMADAPNTAYGLPHGVCCAVLLPAVCEYNLIAEPARFADIATALGENIEGLTAMEAAAKVPVAIRRLNRDIGMPADLGEIGVKESDLEAFAKDAIGRVALRTNPRTVTYEQMLGIFQAALRSSLAEAAAR